MLEIRGATVNYPIGHRVVRAVSDVDLDVPDGAVLALLGPSGCGKSTLLRAIAGLEPINSGRICWDGTDLADIPVHHRGFGLMFQEGVLFPHRDVAGNIAYGLRRVGLPRAEIDSRVTELLELVGLPGYGPRRVATLSGGEAQRVALARALIREPRLLLLDEPFAALDALTRLRMQDLVRELCRAHSPGALFVTHDVDEAIRLADRVLVLSGRTDDGTRAVGQLTVDTPVVGHDPASPEVAALRLRLLDALGVHTADAPDSGT